jgi:hypothetical protein
MDLNQTAVNTLGYQRDRAPKPRSAAVGGAPKQGSSTPNEVHRGFRPTAGSDRDVVGSSCKRVLFAHATSRAVLHALRRAARPLRPASAVAG